MKAKGKRERRSKEHSFRKNPGPVIRGRHRVAVLLFAVGRDLIYPYAGFREWLKIQRKKDILDKLRILQGEK